MKKLINFTLCLFLCSGAAFAEQSLSERIKLARNNNLGWPAVTYAIDQKDSEVLKFLIDMGENLEELTPGTPAPLIGSISMGSNQAILLWNMRLKSTMLKR